MTKLYNEIKACERREDAEHILTFVSLQDLRREYIDIVFSDRVVDSVIADIKEAPKKKRAKKTKKPDAI